MDLGDIASIGSASRSAGTATSDAPRSGCGRMRHRTAGHGTAGRPMASNWSHAMTDAKLEDAKLEDAERVADSMEHSIDKSVPGLSFRERVEIRKGIALLRR